MEPPTAHVSVIIPTYNRAEMLRAALESVLAQTMSVREIVVVDDGSTDHTPDVVRELVSRGAPIIYLTGPHRNNLREARTCGVEASSGALIAFLDSDDLWRPDRIERQLDALAHQPEAGMAFCNVQRFDERGPFTGGPYLPPTADYNGNILGDLLLEPVAVQSALVVKREAFMRVGGFPNRRINEDYELTLLIAALYPASYVREPLVLMRAHPGSRSRAMNRLAMLEYVKIVSDFLASHPYLPTHVAAQGRRGLANVHLKLANLYLEEGDKRRARRHVGAFVKLRPLDRRMPAALLRLWSPTR